MATWVPDRGKHDAPKSLLGQASYWFQKLLFYAYVVAAVGVFVYPEHYLASSGNRVAVGRYILYTAPFAYQADSVQIIREVMLVTIIFLTIIHLFIRFGPET